MSQMNLIPLEQAGCAITHHFSSGVYAKQVDIPEGVTLQQHVHEFDHLSILASGEAIVLREDESIRFRGPVAITIEAGVQHSVVALTDCVWFCIHATDETDPYKIDASVIKKD